MLFESADITAIEELPTDRFDEFRVVFEKYVPFVTFASKETDFVVEAKKVPEGDVLNLSTNEVEESVVTGGAKVISMEGAGDSCEEVNVAVAEVVLQLEEEVVCDVVNK